MDAAEITRRCKALIALAPDERPIAPQRLAQVAGLAKDIVFVIASERHTMTEETRRRMARALTLVENDQIRVKKRPMKPSLIQIVEPQPPVRTRQVVEIGPNGPRIRTKAENPNAFPEN